MAVRVTERAKGKLLEIIVTGTLRKEDYEYFTPMIEQAIGRQGKVRILLKMVEFQGWTLSAAWEDLKFDLKHFNDVERLAMVGDKSWERGMATFCRPFTTAKLRYFTFDQLEDAYEWIEEGVVRTTSQIRSYGAASA